MDEVAIAMTKPKRIDRDRCCGVLVDVQGFFLAQLQKRTRSKIVTNTKNFLRLLNHFAIPVVATVERPLDWKGPIPPEVRRDLGDHAKTFEKDYFDLSREKPIRDHLAGLKKKQMIVAGCESDVCVMQSCLGLISLGYEVYVVEELLFSSARNVASALARLEAEGATFVTYKTLYYELLEAVQGGRRRDKFGPLPDDIPDTAVQ